MRKIGFDNDKYIELQSKTLKERVSKFNRLYIEFGGKLFDDYHASRVLPGFMPDSKIRMLLSIKDKVEMILVINANDIQNNKTRSDIGITYAQDLTRLIDAFNTVGLDICGVVITQYNNQSEAKKFRKKLEKSNIQCAYHYPIDNYPNDIDKILSKDGFGKNEYLKTNKEIAVITAPGPGSGKLATCLSQIYHDNLNGIKAGYAKFETFPVWNLPLNHPVNLAYEAATANLSDVNMIDPFHLQEYEKVAINYNRDVEAFPVLNNLLNRVIGKSVYKSPTDMGVNMVGYCISDDEACKIASSQEIIRRYYEALVDYTKDKVDENVISKLETILSKVEANKDDRKVAVVANELAKKTKEPVTAIELPSGKIITGKTSKLLGSSSAALLNALKEVDNLPDVELLDSKIIEPIGELKTKYLHGNNPRLHTDEVLVALAIGSKNSYYCARALYALDKLKYSEVHSTVILNEVDINTFKKLGCNLTMDPIYQSKKLYHKP